MVNINNKKTAINLIANIIAFAVNFAISFFLSPYIIETLGSEAYGYVTLANNFVNYASLLTIALNSMAGRFITIKIHQNDNEGANKYFNSVLYANSVSAILLLFPFVFCVLYINRLINVPVKIFADVQMLFAFIFLNFIIGIVGSTFNVATFATNRLELSSLRSIEASGIRTALILGLFYFLKPSIIFLGITACVTTAYNLIANVYYTKKLLPQISISKKYFDFKAVLEIATSGIWNTITRLGQVLLEELDLLITNLFISSVAMGTLAIAKTVPVLMSSIVGMISGVFMPELTIAYAKNDIHELIRSTKKAMKIMSIIVGIPVSILIAFGDVFFKLWIPSQDASSLQFLSVLAVFPLIVAAPATVLHNIFTVVNKLKVNSLLMISTGILNFFIVLVLLKTTSLGLIAVTCVSSCFSVIRNLFYTVPAGAIYLKCKWNTFIPEVIKSIVSVIIVSIIGFGVKNLMPSQSWLNFAVFVGITSLLGLALNFLIIFSKDEKKYLLNVLQKKFK